MSYNYDRPDQVQKYTGLPKGVTEKEESLWEKFLAALIPWMKKKWTLGNEFLEAKVEKEKNEADKIKAETELIRLQAQREAIEIAELAGQKEEEAARDIDNGFLSEEDLNQGLEGLAGKIKLLHLKYGLRISIQIEQPAEPILKVMEKMPPIQEGFKSE